MEVYMYKKTPKMLQNKMHICPSHGPKEWNQIDCVETVGIRRGISSLVTYIEGEGRETLRSRGIIAKRTHSPTLCDSQDHP